MQHDIIALPIDLYAFTRWVAYCAALITIGAAALGWVLAKFDSVAGRPALALSAAREAAARMALVAPIVLLSAHLLRLYGQVSAFLEPGESMTSDGVNAIVLGTTWGHGWILQLLAAVLSIALLAAAQWRYGRGDTRHGRDLALIVALLIAFTSPLTGHALEHPWGRTVGVLLHGIHMLGAGIWLGMLFGVFLAGFSAIRDGGAFDGAALLGRLVRAYSPFALTGAAGVVGAGVVLALAYVGNLDSLWSTTYGKTLLVKVALLAGVAALGAFNWRSLTPRLESPEGASLFRTSASAELTLGALLLAATAILVALPAPNL
jgi:putative copper export protein